MICGKEYKMKNRFLIGTPMTVEAAKELIDYFNAVNKTVRGLMAFIEGTDLVISLM